VSKPISTNIHIGLKIGGRPVFNVGANYTNLGLQVNRWQKVYINLDAFIEKYDGLVGNTAKVAFMPFKFDLANYLLAVRVGEMKLIKEDSIVNYNTETSAIDIAVSNSENADYSVKILDNTGAEVTDFAFVLDKENNLYSYNTTAAGTYTVEVTYNYLVKQSKKTSTSSIADRMETVTKTYTITF